LKQWTWTKLARKDGAKKDLGGKAEGGDGVAVIYA
jgi:hypothetical protein